MLGNCWMMLRQKDIKSIIVNCVTNQWFHQHNLYMVLYRNNKSSEHKLPNNAEQDLHIEGAKDDTRSDVLCYKTKSAYESHELIMRGPAVSVLLQHGTCPHTQDSADLACPRTSCSSPTK